MLFHHNGKIGHQQEDIASYWKATDGANVMWQLYANLTFKGFYAYSKSAGQSGVTVAFVAAPKVAEIYVC